MSFRHTRWALVATVALLPSMGQPASHLAFRVLFDTTHHVPGLGNKLALPV